MRDLAPSAISKVTRRSGEHHPALAATVATTSLGFFVVQLDVSIVNVALARMATALGAEITGLQWIVDAYTIAFAALLLSAGTLGDRIGARRTFRAGFLLFGAASLACSFAPSTTWLTVARVIQGVGAALLVPGALALIAHAAAEDHAARARAIAIWTASGGVAVAAGPVIGGVLVSAFGWQSIFLVNVPLCALGWWMTTRYTTETVRSASRHLDWPGQLLAIVALVGLTGAVIEAGPRGVWDPLVVGGLAVALVAGIAFVVADARQAEPMLPKDLLQEPVVVATSIVGFIINLTFYGLVFVLSLYFQQTQGYSPARTGIAFLPLTALLIVVNIGTGWIAPRIGYRNLLCAGLLVAAAGYGVLHSVHATSAYAALAPGLVLVPIGTGLAVPTMTTVLLATVDRAQSGTASAILNATRQVGGAIGVALFGALAAGAPSHIPVGVAHATIVAVIALVAGAALARQRIPSASKH